MSKQLLYKFRNWLDSYHQQCLTGRAIYFASPSQFNDPFDCTINYRYDLLSEEEKFEKYVEHIKFEKPFLNDEAAKSEAQLWMKEGLLETDAALENNKRIISSLVYSNVGVFSLTKTKDPILLWSHYADSHRGYCIGYDVDVLRADFMNKYSNPQKVFYELNVQYEKEYPKIIPRKNMSEADFVSIPLRTKSEIWSYEQEFRFIILGASRELTRVPPEAIAEVTIGCNVLDKHQIEIGEYVIRHLPHTDLYLAKMHPESYSLIFQKMN